MKAIFVCEPPKASAEEKPCATNILSRIARLAYHAAGDESRYRPRFSSFSIKGRRDDGFGS